MPENKQDKTQTENQPDRQVSQGTVEPSHGEVKSTPAAKTEKPKRKNEHYGVGSTTYEGEEILGAKPVTFPAGHLSRD